MRPGAMLLAVLALCLQALGADDAEWARFRGPNGGGVGSAANLPVQWTDADYNWKVRLPGVGHSSPVVWGQHVYVTCGDPKTAQRVILCVDAATGRTLWQRAFESHPFTQHQDNAYASATPAADADGLVLTWSTPEQVVLLALDHDGREAWRRDLGPFVGAWGTAASPVLVDDLVVLNNDQEDPKAVPSVYSRLPMKEAGKSTVVAVDRKTGKTRWQVDRRSEICGYGTPVVHRGQDGRAQVVTANKAHGVSALDAATGKVVWELPGLFRDRVVASPIVADGLVVATSGAGITGLRCVVVRPGSADGKVPPALVHDIGKPVPLVPTPLARDGLLYLWGDNGIVSCVRLADGRVAWRERVEGSYYSSPVWVDGRLYCVSRGGDMAVIAAGEKFELLGRVPLGDKCQATPAVAGGVMYIRTASALMSLGPRKAP